MPRPDVDQAATWRLEALGTAWQVDTREPLDDATRTAVHALVDRFDRTWSRFRDDSLVADVARAAGTWTFPDEAAGLLDLYDDLHEVTGGAVTPLVGRTLADLGYGAGYALTPVAEPAAVGSWSSVRHDGRVVATTEPVLLDVGAAGKGLLVDLVAALLRETVGPATVDASGDLRHDADGPLRVALEHPRDPRRAIGVVELAPGDALCASATNRRAWGDGLHHVLDGRTGRPTHDVVATWVLVPGSCMLADGLATAHFLADPDALLARWSHQFVRMHADGRVVRSSDLQGEVFA